MMEKRLSQRRWRRRTTRLRRVGVSFLIALIIILGVFARQQRDTAVTTQATAYARETDALAQRKLALSHLSGSLSANALLQLPADPELGLLLAVEGLKTAISPQAEDALREALAYQAPIHPPLRVLSGHTHIVNYATFSPDGSLVLTTGFDGTAIVWQANTGNPVFILQGSKGRVITGAFSPDGQAVRTVNDDGSIYVWDLPLKVSQARSRGSTVKDDGTIYVWDLLTGHNTGKLAGTAGPIESATISQDGKWIVTNSGFQGRAKETQVWATDADMLTTSVAMKIELPGNIDSFWNAAFSPDNQRVIIVSNSGLAQIWDIRAGKLLVELAGHQGGVTSAQFSPDGRFVVTSGVDHTARVWEAATGRSLLTLTGHTASVAQAAFSPDGKFVVTAGADETARIWALSTGRTILTLKGPPGAINSAEFSPDGRFVVTVSDEGSAQIYACEVCRASAAELLVMASAYVKRPLTAEERATYLDGTGSGN
ncbi:MAG: WD40 repeat domain-containing protein [Chloroflexi bacterium]|nr:WD40 repeat domain-containing protein [Chloroflexota bacterium]